LSQKSTVDRGDIYAHKVLDALAILTDNRVRPLQRELPKQSESSFAAKVANFVGGRT
jgi:hypothetical protein